LNRAFPPAYLYISVTVRGAHGVLDGIDEADGVLCGIDELDGTVDGMLRTIFSRFIHQACGLRGG